MTKVYIALLDNGSGDLHIRGIHATHEGALEQLQKHFLEWRRGDHILQSFADAEHPTIEEMERCVDIEIVEVTLGDDLYVELRGGFS